MVSSRYNMLVPGEVLVELSPPAPLREALSLAGRGGTGYLPPLEAARDNPIRS